MKSRFSNQPTLEYQTHYGKGHCRRHKSQDELYPNDFNLWDAKSPREENIFRALRNSDVFGDQRRETFVRFNYRNSESKEVSSDSAFYNLLIGRRAKGGLKVQKGSMHVSDLWGQRQMQQLLGNLPFPNDRLKVLHTYKRGKGIRVKKLVKPSMKNKENK